MVHHTNDVWVFEEFGDDVEALVLKEFHELVLAVLEARLGAKRREKQRTLYRLQ